MTFSPFPSFPGEQHKDGEPKFLSLSPPAISSALTRGDKGGDSLLKPTYECLQQKGDYKESENKVKSPSLGHLLILVPHLPSPQPRRTRPQEAASGSGGTRVGKRDQTQLPVDPPLLGQ